MFNQFVYIDDLAFNISEISGYRTDTDVLQIYMKGASSAICMTIGIERADEYRTILDRIFNPRSIHDMKYIDMECE